MGAFDVYKQTAVETQSKGRLIVMLYDGAVKFLKMAIKDIENEDYESKSEHLTRAQNIITELNSVLDMESGGEIAQNLRKLYHFMRKHINQAGVENSTQKIQEVIGLLEELNQSWKAIAE
jgi:flagellar protein FliS